jgi:hypothetical protein
MNSIRVLRGISAHVEIFPSKKQSEIPPVQLIADQSPQILYFEVATDRSRWQFEVRGEHYGTPLIPMALWETQRALVIGLGCKLHFLSIDDGRTIAQQTLADELYISDLVIDSTHAQLVVATGRSLFLYRTASEVVWAVRDIATDGITIRETRPEMVVVVCEDPGDETSIKRFEWDATGNLRPSCIK